MDERTMVFRAPSGASTELAAGAATAWIATLHGMTCGRYGADPGASRGLGLCLVATDGAVLGPADFALAGTSAEAQGFEIALSHQGSGLRYTSRWRLCERTGVWRRSDAVENRGRAAVTIRDVRARFVLSLGRYELFSQESRWCGENQGAWTPLAHGSFAAGSEGARTCQGSSPVLGVRDAAGGRGLLFHLLPRSAWRMEATAVGAGGLEDPYFVVDVGPAGDDLALVLAPGAAYDLPEVLVQELGEDERCAAPQIHRFALDTVLPAPRRSPPLVYNSWFDAFDRLDPARMERQIDAAAAVGCEVFVVDAGWFGGSDASWAELVGDWREKTNAAFRGRMRDFAQAVRARGLGFGIWCEPERIRPLSPVYREHPEWFLPASPPGVPATDFWPDLEQPGAYGHTLGELCRLAESYELAWIKLDYNFSPARDPRRAAFGGFYERLYALLDELRRRFPGLCVEGCASGGMRADLEALRHVDCHFLTDTVDPVDEIRIGEGALLRMPPGRLARWLVLRSVGRSIIRYGVPLEEAPATVVSPAGAVWEPSITRTARFSWAAAAPSVLGLSGDLAGLEEETRRELAGLLAAYKEVRETIFRGHARLLTPVRPRGDNAGWSALQITAGEEHLLFAYRLDDGAERRRFPLAEVRREARYAVDAVGGGAAARTVAGADLARDGIEVAVDRRYDARVLRIRPAR